MHNNRQIVKRISGEKLQKRNARIFQHEPLCRPCKAKGIVTVATQVDHIIALSNGGTEDPENLQPICKGCNDLKAILEAGLRPKDRELKGLDWVS